MCQNGGHLGKVVKFSGFTLSRVVCAIEVWFLKESYRVLGEEFFGISRNGRNLGKVVKFYGFRVFYGNIKDRDLVLKAKL